MRRRPVGGRAEIADLLIRAGANLEDKTDGTPAKVIPSGFPDIPPKLRPAVPGRSAIQIARDAGHKELALTLIRVKG